MERFVGKDAVKRVVWNEVVERLSRGMRSKEEVSEGMVGVLFVCAGRFELSCANCLV